MGKDEIRRYAFDKVAHHPCLPPPAGSHRRPDMKEAERAATRPGRIEKAVDHRPLKPDGNKENLAVEPPRGSGSRFPPANLLNRRLSAFRPKKDDVNRTDLLEGREMAAKSLNSSEDRLRVPGEVLCKEK